LFAWELAAAGNDVPPGVVDELRVAAQLFDSTLKAFGHGGTVLGGDGKPVHLAAANGPRSAEILRRAETVWGPWRDLLEPLRTLGAHAAMADVAAPHAMHARTTSTCSA
jgi:two-component system, chemotaxis family, sensor kinase CheA